MVRYLVLIQLTDKGVREIDDSAARAAEFVSEADGAGGRVVGQYWAVGQYDGALILEAPNEGTAAVLLLKLAHEGYVRTQSLRLFDAEEFTKFLS